MAAVATKPKPKTFPIHEGAETTMVWSWSLKPGMRVRIRNQVYVVVDSCTFHTGRRINPRNRYRVEKHLCPYELQDQVWSLGFIDSDLREKMIEYGAVYKDGMIEAADDPIHRLYPPKRRKYRIGRWIKRHMPVYSDQTVQEITDLFVAAHTEHFEIVEGQALYEAYCNRQLGGGSCMSDEPSHTRLLADNGHTVKLAIMRLGNGYSRSARCLVWYGEDFKAYDCRYANSELARSLLVQRLKEQGFEPFDTEKHRYSVWLEKKRNHSYPYMDTFCWVDFGSEYPENYGNTYEGWLQFFSDSDTIRTHARGYCDSVSGGIYLKDSYD